MFIHLGVLYLTEEWLKRYKVIHLKESHHLLAILESSCFILLPNEPFTMRRVYNRSIIYSRAASQWGHTFCKIRSDTAVLITGSANVTRQWFFRLWSWDHEDIQRSWSISPIHLATPTQLRLCSSVSSTSVPIFQTQTKLKLVVAVYRSVRWQGEAWKQIVCKMQMKRIILD